MAEARRKDEWERASWIIAYIRQAWGCKEPPAKFNPTTRWANNRTAERLREAIPVDAATLKTLFLRAGFRVRKGVSDGKSN